MMDSVSRVVLLFALVFVAAPADALSDKNRPRQIVVEPELTDKVLINPGAGWQKLCHMGPQGEIEKMPEISTYYFRSLWTHYQSGDGKYGGSAVRTIDNWLEYAHKNGRYVAIRVVPYNSRNPGYQKSGAQKVQGCDSAVPAYIFKKGAKGFAEPGGSGGWVPVFWDKIYLDEHEKLVKWMGKRWGKHPALVYIDLPGGNYGEMNLTNTGIPELDNLSKWKEYGLTPEAWDNMIRRLVKMYKEAFPGKLLVAARDYDSYGKAGTLDYAIGQGVGFRDDGLGMSYCRAGRTNKEYERHWKEVLCLYENGYADWTSSQWGGRDTVRSTLDWALNRTHAGIVMVGKGTGCEKAYGAYKDFVTEFGRKLGYRFEIRKASWYSHPRKKSTLTLQLIVRNAGNVPVYFDSRLEIALLTSGGKVAYSGRFETTPPIRQWLPSEQPFKVTVRMKLGSKVPTGKFALAIGIVNAANLEQRIELPLKKTAGNRRYLLGAVHVRSSSMKFSGKGGAGGPSTAEAAPAASAAAGPLAAYADKLKAPALFEAARDFSAAAQLYGDLARAADEKARPALNRLAAAARAAAALRGYIEKKAGRGKRVAIYVEFAGRKVRGKVTGAGKGGIGAIVMGQPMSVPWKKLSNAGFYRLSKAYAPQAAGAQLQLLAFAMRAGLAEKVNDQLAHLRSAFPGQAQAVRELMRKR